MRYADLKLNDSANGPGVNVSFWVQGCPYHCCGCHNHDTWDFNGGKEFTHEVLESIVQGLRANGIHRGLSILGGEPLCPENAFLTRLVISTVKKEIPDTKIYVWTGNLYENLRDCADPNIKAILKEIDVLIDGPYIESERDITLPMRGSRNQRIINLKEVNCND